MERAVPPWFRRDGLGTGMLLALTLLLYTWGLDRSGWANAYYSAAAQAGAESWKAFFFGSLDAANAITVDKTPLALWPMALSVRFFGLSSWSILVPQALFGVATVWLTVRIVRRSTGSHPVALLAGATLALTPVAALMFRFNNPDALLVLLLTAAAGATLRAVEESRRGEGRPLRWVVLGGALVGLAYLAKMLQAFLVLPALGLTYLLFAAVPLSRRLLHLLAAAGALVAAAGWWVVAVALWPVDSRPFIGGSQHNSVLDLTLGYNGLGRLNGDEEGSIGSGHWGGTSLVRLLTPSNGGQAGWLLPTSLILLVAGLLLAARRTERSTELRAVLTLFGTWLVVTTLVFSLMRGIFHAYYAVALAPAIAVVFAVAGALLWRSRQEPLSNLVLGATVLGTGLWSFALLARTSDFVPWLRWLVAAAGLVAGLTLLLGTKQHPRWVRRTSPVALVLTLLVALAGPAAYSVATAALPHQGAVITAGPEGRGTRIVTLSEPPHPLLRLLMPPGVVPDPARPATTRMRGAFPERGAPEDPLTVEFVEVARALRLDVLRPTYGPAGSLLYASLPSRRVVALLRETSARARWAAATVGANAAAGFQLATRLPVMAIGGFNGTDPTPTLTEFRDLVATGQVRWFIGGGLLGPRRGGSDAAEQITTWVALHAESRTIDGIVLYDLAPLRGTQQASSISGSLGPRGTGTERLAQ